MQSTPLAAAAPAVRASSSGIYIPELDALRAFSILTVITCHMKNPFWWWIDGRLGVIAFFVLSGYLITMLALREERDRGRLDLPAFYVRRVFRLFPVYYLVLGLYCVLIFGLGVVPEKRAALWASLPYYLLYFQEQPVFLGIHGDHANMTFIQSWSLGFEEKFYLLWPLLGFVLLRQGGARRMACAALLGLAAAFAPATIGWHFGEFFYSYSHILVGCLIATLLDEPKWLARFQGLFVPWVNWCILALFLGLFYQYEYASFAWEIVRRSVFGLTAGLLVISIVLRRSPAQRLLRAPILAQIGKWSYGMYLIHILVVNGVEKIFATRAGDPFTALRAYASTCLLSALIAAGLSIAIESTLR